MALPGLAARSKRLKLIEKARGANAREQLEQAVHSLQNRQIADGRAALEQIKSLVKSHAHPNFAKTVDLRLFGSANN